MNTTTSTTETRSYTDYMEFKVSDMLWKVASPALIVLGTMGNILSIIVLTRKSMRQSTVSIYLSVLAITDILVLQTGLLRQWLRVVLSKDIRQFHFVLCKLHVWLVYFTLDFSSWLLVAVTLERFVSVWFPHTVKHRCTKRSAGLIIAGIATVLLVVNSHFLYGLGERTFTQGNATVTGQCYFLNSEYAQFSADIWPWIDLCLFCLLPFSLLFLGNVAIIIKVCLSNRRRRQEEGTNTTSVSQRISVRSAKASSMTVMLLTTNFVFLICTLPICVFLIGEKYWFQFSPMKEQSRATHELTWAVVNIIMYTNNAINFILYCISGSWFRGALKNLFLRKRRIHPTASFTRNLNSNLGPVGNQQPSTSVETRTKLNVAVVGGDLATCESEL